MSVQFATMPGRTDRPDGDFARAPRLCGPAHGAGGPAEMPSGCIHGTDWFVRQLGTRTLALRWKISTGSLLTPSSLWASPSRGPARWHLQPERTRHPAATVIMTRAPVVSSHTLCPGT